MPVTINCKKCAVRQYPNYKLCNHVTVNRGIIAETDEGEVTGAWASPDRGQRRHVIQSQQEEDYGRDAIS